MIKMKNYNAKVSFPQIHEQLFLLQEISTMFGHLYYDTFTSKGKRKMS